MMSKVSSSEKFSNKFDFLKRILLETLYLFALSQATVSARADMSVAVNVIFFLRCFVLCARATTIAPLPVPTSTIVNALFFDFSMCLSAVVMSISVAGRGIKMERFTFRSRL